MTSGKTFQQQFSPSAAFWVSVTCKGQAASSILHPPTRPLTHFLVRFSPSIFCGPGLMGCWERGPLQRYMGAFHVCALNPALVETGHCFEWSHRRNQPMRPTFYLFFESWLLTIYQHTSTVCLLSNEGHRWDPHHRAVTGVCLLQELVEHGGECGGKGCRENFPKEVGDI